MEITNDKYCVYAHINKTNSKIYIGQTVYGDNPNLRWANGEGYKSSVLFYNAIQKYGWDNFDHEIIASNLTLDEANNFEELLINLLNTTNRDKGYNLQSGGKNCRLSDETKEKISKANKGENNYWYGKHRSDDFKNIMSEKLKGSRNPMYGKHPSQETLYKLSKSHKGKNNGFFGKHHSDETKQKMSRAKKGLYINEKHPRAKQVICVETNISYNTVKEASEKTKINKNCISACCRGERKTAGGYHWKYYEGGDSLCL